MPGGRPKNDWSSTRLRKLARLHTLGSTNVKLITEIIARDDDGFKPSLRDVYTQLARIHPEDSSRRRRRSELRHRSNHKNTSAQLKPRATRYRTTMQRRSALATLSTESLLASGVVEDAFYNPLAHWDFFSDVETRFVTLEQVLTRNDDTANNEYAGGIRNVGSLQDMVVSKRDIRKKKLRSIIATSELSFVVSLLSSRWSKSSLHTRVLSDTSITDRFCDILWNPSTTLDTAHSDTSNASQDQCLHSYLRLQPQAVSLGWRPCCGLNGSFYDPTWNCRTCGFSAILYQTRLAGRWFIRDSPGADDQGDLSSMMNNLVEMIEYIKADPVLSQTRFPDDLEIDTTQSATLEFLEQNLQSATSDLLIQNERNEIGQRSNRSTALSNLAHSQLFITDRFGNTALHHAAAAQNFEAISTLLNIGIQAEALNTYGQTFLHLLDVRDEIERYIEVLRYLMRQTSPFPFLHKDHYGFTIFHRFILSTIHTENVSPEHMSEIHSLLGNQHLKANQGMYEVVDVELDFEARFADLAVENWASGDKDIATELDKHGNTCLIAILKMWPTSGCWSVLLELIDHLTTDREFNVNVNAYDREGNTALAIAARKGLYSAVKRLLVLGANPNATNYERSSILEYVQIYRRAARKANDNQLYAAILKCEEILAKFGAMRNVTALVEFSVRRSTVVEAIQRGCREDMCTAAQRLPVQRLPAQTSPYQTLPGATKDGTYKILKSTFICHKWNDYDSQITLNESRLRDPSGWNR